MPVSLIYTSRHTVNERKHDTRLQPFMSQSHLLPSPAGHWWISPMFRLPIFFFSIFYISVAWSDNSPVAGEAS